MKGDKRKKLIVDIYTKNLHVKNVRSAEGKYHDNQYSSMNREFIKRLGQLNKIEKQQSEETKQKKKEFKEKLKNLVLSRKKIHSFACREEVAKKPVGENQAALDPINVSYKDPGTNCRLMARSMSPTKISKLDKIYGSTLPPFQRQVHNTLGLNSPGAYNKLLKPVGSKAFGAEFAMWKKMKGIAKDTKVFSIYGDYPDIRDALIRKGWEENKDEESPYWDMLWTKRAKLPNLNSNSQMINHFGKIYEISTKIELAENIKKLEDIEGVSQDIFFPRSFSISSDEGVREFMDYFKVVKAESVLKKFVSGENVPIEKVSVCLDICSRRARNLPVKGTQKRYVSKGEWRVLSSDKPGEVTACFARHYSHLKTIKESSITTEAQKVLHELAYKDPQHFLNGISNMWIVKPGRKSRGRDIQIFNSLSDIFKYTTRDQDWVIQKYIENPLILCKKKFDIRQWVLVTSMDPLTIWIYDECYLRFGLEDYNMNPNKIHDLYMHLTNNSVIKNSTAYDSAEIQGCMWHVRQFQEYLSSTFGSDIWRQKIFPRMKDIIKWSLMCVTSKVPHRTHSFELLGYDFMIDTDFTPWLLEVNTSPAMDYSTKITETLVKKVLSDTIEVVLNNEEDRNEVGLFKLYYKGRKGA